MPQCSILYLPAADRTFHPRSKSGAFKFCFRNHIQVVYIRFPNDTRLPLSSCEAGNVIYIFVNGEVTVCPYLVFAAKTPGSKHDPNEFIVGNILNDSDIAQKLDNYHFRERYHLGDNSTCKSCPFEKLCGKGCPAAVIASGQRIEGVDREVCPFANISEKKAFDA